MPSCAVKSCKHNTVLNHKDQGITFHRFPVGNEAWSSDWVKIIRITRGQDDWTPSKSSVICSIHFEESDLYHTPKGYRRVVTYGIPKLFLGEAARPFPVYDLQQPPLIDCTPIPIQPSPQSPTVKIEIHEEELEMSPNEHDQINNEEFETLPDESDQMKIEIEVKTEIDDINPNQRLIFAKEIERPLPAPGNLEHNAEGTNNQIQNTTSQTDHGRNSNIFVCCNCGFVNVSCGGQTTTVPQPQPSSFPFNSIAQQSKQHYLIRKKLEQDLKKKIDNTKKYARKIKMLNQKVRRLERRNKSLKEELRKTTTSSDHNDDDDNGNDE